MKVGVLLFILTLSSTALAGFFRPTSKPVPGRNDVVKVVHKGLAVTPESPFWRFTVKVLDGEKICTGVLIHQQFVLTAGHCAAAMTPNRLEFYNGSSELVGARMVEKMWVHPDYSREGSDLAVLQFAGGFPSADYQSVDLLTDLQEVPPDAPIFAAGFGLTDPDHYGVLTTGRGTLVARQEKSFGFEDGTNFYPCAGDSGGPAIYFKNEKPLLIGIAWLGYSLCDDSGGGGDYTSVPYFYSWIQKIIREAGADL